MASRTRKYSFRKRGSRSVGQQPKQSRAAYPTHPLLQLRETLGNQAYGRFIQAKLNTGEPVDPHKQVARQIADVPSSEPKRETALAPNRSNSPLPRESSTAEVGPAIGPAEPTTLPEDKFPLSWYKRYAKDEQAIEIFNYWLESHGAEIRLENDNWRRYMMANKLLEEQLIDQLKEDALVRQTWLRQGNAEELAGDLGLIRFHAEIENGYDTGYKLLHGTNRDVGDFEIKGSFVARNAQAPGETASAVSVFYDLRLTWNDITDPLKDHFTDELAVILIKLLSDYHPKKYVLRITWNAQAKVTITKGMVFVAFLQPIK